MKPRVSVILPIYNSSKWLKICLDTVVNQTLQDIEIICVNDGSTDDSPDILKEYAKNDSRIIIIDKKNAGMGAAYNSGLDVAKGEYIGFVEPDDYIKLNMYEELYNRAQTKPDIVKSDYYWFENDAIKQRYQYKKYESEKLYKNFEIIDLMFNHVSHWSAIYKKTFLNKHNLRFTETAGAAFQDYGFTTKAILLANNIYLTKNAYYCYRKHQGQSFNQCNIKVLFSILNEWNLNIDYIEKNLHSFSQKSLEMFNLAYFRILLWCYSLKGDSRNYKYLKIMSKILNNKILIRGYNPNNFSKNENIIYNLIKNNCLFAYIYIYIYIKYSRFIKKIRQSVLLKDLASIH